MGHIGDLLRHYRVSLGLSQAKLAKEVPTTAQSISNYENEERLPDIYTFMRLKELLGFEWWEIEQRKICEPEEVEGDPYLWNDLCRPRLSTYETLLQRSFNEKNVLFEWDQFEFIEAINLSYKPSKSFFIVDLFGDEEQLLNEKDRIYYEVDARTMLELYVDYKENNDLFETVQSLGLFDTPSPPNKHFSFELQHPEWKKLFSFVHDLSKSNVIRNRIFKTVIYETDKVFLNGKHYSIKKVLFEHAWRVDLIQEINGEYSFSISENTANSTFQSLVDINTPLDDQMIEWAVKMIEQEKECHCCGKERPILELDEWQYEECPEFRGHPICSSCFSKTLEKMRESEALQ